MSEVADNIPSSTDIVLRSWKTVPWVVFFVILSPITHLEKIKLLQVLCQYILPKLASADYSIGSPDEETAVTIKFVDSLGNDISHKKQDEIKHLQTLDENDLGLAQDMNRIFNS